MYYQLLWLQQLVVAQTPRQHYSNISHHCRPVLTPLHGEGTQVHHQKSPKTSCRMLSFSPNMRNAAT